MFNMITEIIEGYLQTGSGRLSERSISAGILACLNIVPHSGNSTYPQMGLDESKFSFVILSGGILIAQIDNDHPLNISGSQFYGLHQHEFSPLGETISRVLVSGIVNIGEAGSLAERLWKDNS